MDLERLRNISCIEILEDLNYNIINEGKYHRCQLEVNNHKFNIVINNNNKFFDNNNKIGGYGAIDLLVKVLQFNFKDALEYLTLFNENS